MRWDQRVDIASVVGRSVGGGGAVGHNPLEPQLPICDVQDSENIDIRFRDALEMTGGVTTNTASHSSPCWKATNLVQAEDHLYKLLRIFQHA